MDRYELIAQNVQTVLLGNCRSSRRLAREIYRRYGIRSYICDTRRTFGSFFALSYAFWSVPDLSFGDIVCEELRHLSSFDPSCIYVAVACSEEFAAFIDHSDDLIDDVYIIASPEDVFGKFPIFDRTHSK